MRDHFVKRVRTAAVVGSLITGITSQGMAHAKGVYTEIVVQGSARTEADFINMSGAVAGHYDTSDTQPAFLRAADGTLTTFSAPGAVSTTPTGLNDDGAIGGFFTLPSSPSRAFYRDASGTLTVFDPPAPGLFTVGGINAKGEIVGTFGHGHGSFIRHINGQFSTFRVKGAKFGTWAKAINDHGDVVGGYTDANVVGHGFLRTHSGVIVKFDPPCGGTFDKITSVVAINNAGVIAGQCESSDQQGFVRTPDGSFLVFGAPSGGEFPTVEAINRKGAVTGCYYDPARDLARGFIRKANGKFVVFDVPGHASTIMCSQSINDSDQVAGYAFTPSESQEVGFIRTP